MANEQNLRPPWPKGTTGNPNGRPKGLRSLSIVIQEFMDDPKFEVKLKNGEILKGRPSRHIVETMFKMSISGNTKAAEWLAKYGYGTKVDITSDGEQIQFLNAIPRPNKE